MPYNNNQYLAKVNRVMDYAENNLEGDLSLNKLAQVACLSPFYFHRIFRSLTGQTLNQFIQRIRIEKAATLLLQNKEIPITEIAFQLGFSSSASFARLFKENFEMSASTWRKDGYKNSKICKTRNKIRKEKSIKIDYISPIKQEWRIEMQNKEKKLEADVKVMDLSALRIAYVRHTGPYKGAEELFASLYEKLTRWAAPRGILSREDIAFYNVYHDNPEITEDEQLRVSVGVSIKNDDKVDGDIGSMDLPGGKYAVARFRIDADQYQEAWDAVCGDWLSQSGYEPDDRPVFERMISSPEDDPEGKHNVEICVPLKSF